MKKVLGAVVIASLTLAGCAKNIETTVEQDQVSAPVVEKLSMSARQSFIDRSTVEFINLETRRVNLRREDGTLSSTVISKDARNLDQVKVGDIVVIEYVKSLEIDVVSIENAEAAIAEASVMAQAKKGATPGMAKIETLIATAIVEEVNLEANTFKLKNAKGEINEYVAKNPDNLKKVAVGDMVIITLTEALAIIVDSAK